MSQSKADEKLIRCLSFNYNDEASKGSEGKNDEDGLTGDKYGRGASVQEISDSKADELIGVSIANRETTKEGDSENDRGITAEVRCQSKKDEVSIMAISRSSHAGDEALEIPDVPLEMMVFDTEESVAAEFAVTAGSKMEEDHDSGKERNGAMIDYKKHISSDNKSEKTQTKDDGTSIAISTRSSLNLDAPLCIFDMEVAEAGQFEGEIQNCANDRNETTIVENLSTERNSAGPTKPLLQIIDNDGTIMHDSDENTFTEPSEKVGKADKADNLIMTLDRNVDTTIHDENGIIIQAPTIHDQSGNEDSYIREDLINNNSHPISAFGGTVKSSTVNFEGLAPWLPPSILHAVEYKQRSIFREGTSSLWETDVTKASDLSRGVLLYFEFARSASLCMLLLSILSIPSIIFSYFGQRIPIADRDAIGFSQFTIGNIGYDRSSLTYKTDSTCKNQPSSYTGRCITIFGSEIKFADAETVLTTFEFLQIVIYLLFIIRLLWRSASFSRREANNDIKIADYTVMCRRLPGDTTTDELVEHFNDLYPLDREDWKKRSPLKGVRTVQNSEYSGKYEFIGTWIADCVIFSGIGKALRTFKAHEGLTIALLRSRALVSMYSEGTCHKKGVNLKKKEKAENQLKYFLKKIENLTEKLKFVYKNNDQLQNLDNKINNNTNNNENNDGNNNKNNNNDNNINPHSPNTNNNTSAHENNFQTYSKISGSNIVAGFVTFEYCEGIHIYAYIIYIYIVTYLYRCINISCMNINIHIHIRCMYKYNYIYIRIY